MSNIFGRQVIVLLLNNSGGGVIAGDVVVPDGSANSAFTTTTSASSVSPVWIVQETIASAGTGRVLIGGYAALVNVNASVTRGHYGATHTVAKQAADGGASRTVGTFCRFLTGGTTPIAYVYPTDLLGSSLTNPMTTTGDIIQSSDNSGTPARLAAPAAGKFLTGAGTSTVVAWGQGPLTTTGDLMIGATGGTPTRLAVGTTAGHVLTGGTTPAWSKVITGIINSDGTTNAGTGFSSSKTATGRYTITFTVNFGAQPIVLCQCYAAVGSAGICLLIATPAVSGFSVETTNLSFSDTDKIWNFIAYTVA